MSWGDVKPFTFGAVSSGVTFTSVVDLGQGWGKYALEIPTMASGTDIAIQGCATDSGTFRRIYWSGSTATPSGSFNSSITNCIVNIAGGLPRYVKVEIVTAMTAVSGTVFKIHCWN